MIQRNQSAIMKRILEQMDKSGADALILTGADDVFYATGFASMQLYNSRRFGSTAAVIRSDGKATLILSEFEKQAADSVCDKTIEIAAYPTFIYIEDYSAGETYKNPDTDPMKVYKMALEACGEGTGKVGLVYYSMDYRSGEFFSSHLGNRIFDAARLMADAKMIKTPWEIQTLRTAAEITESAINRTMSSVKEGMTEAEIRMTFEQLCEQQSPDVAGVTHAHTVGRNFAPSYIPRDVKVVGGDLIRLDGGVFYKGYNSDIARTCSVGGKTLKERENVYSALFAGYSFAINHAGPGVLMCDIFNGAQKVIKEKGLDCYIRGHHGHSISCNTAVEELPLVSPEEKRVFMPGMVMCFEFPYYGSRLQTYNIEDTVLITENGIELFTHAPDSLYPF